MVHGISWVKKNSFRKIDEEKKKTQEESTKMLRCDYKERGFEFRTFDFRNSFQSTVDQFVLQLSKFFFGALLAALPLHLRHFLPPLLTDCVVGANFRRFFWIGLGVVALFCARYSLGDFSPIFFTRLYGHSYCKGSSWSGRGPIVRTNKKFEGKKVPTVLHDLRKS